MCREGIRHPIGSEIPLLISERALLFDDRDCIGLLHRPMFQAAGYGGHWISNLMLLVSCFCPSRLQHAKLRLMLSISSLPITSRSTLGSSTHWRTTPRIAATISAPCASGFTSERISPIAIPARMVLAKPVIELRLSSLMT